MFFGYSEDTSNVFYYGEDTTDVFTCKPGGAPEFSIAEIERAEFSNSAH